jgi:hypothetical protein
MELSETSQAAAAKHGSAVLAAAISDRSRRLRSNLILPVNVDQVSKRCTGLGCITVAHTHACGAFDAHGRVNMWPRWRSVIVLADCVWLPVEQCRLMRRWLAGWLQVKVALRALGVPATLFGEGPYERSERLAALVAER